MCIRDSHYNFCVLLFSFRNDIKKAKRKSKAKKPKRNTCAYILFGKRLRQEMSPSLEGLNAKEKLLKIAHLWENLKEEERDPYYREAELDRLRYLKELQAYYEENPMRFIEKKDARGKREKRRMNPFLLFMQRARSENQQYYSKLSNSEAIKELSQQWKAMSEEQKRQYYDEYQTKKKRDIDLSLKTLNRKEMKKKKKSEIMFPMRVILPKASMSPFFCFLRAVRIEMKAKNPTSSSAEINKMIGSMWQGLSEVEKRKYYEISEQDKRRFREELKKKFALKRKTPVLPSTPNTNNSVFNMIRGIDNKNTPPKGIMMESTLPGAHEGDQKKTRTKRGSASWLADLQAFKKKDQSINHHLNSILLNTSANTLNNVHRIDTEGHQAVERKMSGSDIMISRRRFFSGDPGLDSIYGTNEDFCFTPGEEDERSLDHTKLENEKN
eukprot:TRINITY_DN1414_c0_g1_i15.p1 TRINITY_DN1414_c0_g1~~TRINITY_DN1414_c0_g1_i15.p1  ORF type:complete len:439 (-),score=71.55 TRINITY_DN1414_c0_g1_i15:198-1514(-)